ncbi:MAG: hypothetical protein CR955_00880 [Thiotrichales bacterium]|nr:MAG: hypothetical protein CR955_00880 [Thiotrichales bacterium]
MKLSQDRYVEQRSVKEPCYEVKESQKSALQKSSLYFAAGSIMLAVVSVIYLSLKIDTLGWQNPISASLLASTFFFLFVAVVLLVIGTANIPSFKVGND